MINFMILEAVYMTVLREDEEERKKQERKDWKEDRDHLFEATGQQ